LTVNIFCNATLLTIIRVCPGNKQMHIRFNARVVHAYLGMTIDYNKEGRVKFTMYDYIDDLLEELPPSMRGSASSPAAAHQFETNTEYPKLLSLPEREVFHHRVAQLLYLSKRARPDIQ